MSSIHTHPARQLHSSTPLHSTLHSTPLHSAPLRSAPLRSIIAQWPCPLTSKWMDRWQGSVHQSAQKMFESIARTFVSELNVDGILCAKVDGYEELANRVGLTTTLVAVPREARSAYIFHLRADTLRQPLIVKLTKSQLKTFRQCFQAEIAPVTASVGSAVTADSSLHPATRALGASVVSLSSQVSALQQKYNEHGRVMDDQRRDLDDQERVLLGVKRKQTEMQRQLRSLADDSEWVRRLAQGEASSVESLRADLHAMQTAIEATMARKLGAMEASAAERCKKTIIEMMVMSESTVALAAPPSGTSQVKCYVCLEDIEREEPAAHLCDQQSHAIHVECCRGILSAAGTDTGDGYHRFSRTAVGARRCDARLDEGGAHHREAGVVEDQELLEGGVASVAQREERSEKSSAIAAVVYLASLGTPRSG